MVDKVVSGVNSPGNSCGGLSVWSESHQIGTCAVQVMPNPPFIIIIIHHSLLRKLVPCSALPRLDYYLPFQLSSIAYSRVTKKATKQRAASHDGSHDGI